jgi:hypothetical protein
MRAARWWRCMRDGFSGRFMGRGARGARVARGCTAREKTLPSRPVSKGVTGVDGITGVDRIAGVDGIIDAENMR